MLIGANVSMSGKAMFPGAVAEAVSYGATTLQFYTGAPQNTRRKAHRLWGTYCFQPDFDGANVDHGACWAYLGLDCYEDWACPNS